MNRIECNLNKELTIILENCVQVYGHDDSFPFNADLYILKHVPNSEELNTKRIAKCWNDGWGGGTCIDYVNKEARELGEFVDNYIKEHYLYVDGSWSMAENLESFVNNLAMYCILDKKNIMKPCEFLNVVER